MRTPVVWRQAKRDIADLRRAGAVVTDARFERTDFEDIWTWARTFSPNLGPLIGDMCWESPQGDKVTIGLLPD